MLSKSLLHHYVYVGERATGTVLTLRFKKMIGKRPRLQGGEKI